MKQNVCNLIESLLNYAEQKNLIDPLDRVFCRNRIMEELGVSSYDEQVCACPQLSLEEILCALCDYAIQSGVIEDRGITGRDLLDTKLMGILTPRPSEVVREFNRLYAESPEAATDYFYKLSCDL